MWKFKDIQDGLLDKQKKSLLFYIYIIHVSNVQLLVSRSSLETLSVHIYPWELSFQEFEWLMKHCEISQQPRFTFHANMTQKHQNCTLTFIHVI